MFRDQLSPQNPPVPAFDSHAQGFSTTLARRRSSFPPPSLNMLLVYPIVFHGTLGRTAVRYHAFHDDSTICLSRAASSRRAQNCRSEEAHHVNTIPSHLNGRRVPTDRLDRVGNQLVCNHLRMSPTLHPSERPPTFLFIFISLIADGPHHYNPACGH